MAFSFERVLCKLPLIILNMSRRIDYRCWDIAKKKWIKSVIVTSIGVDSSNTRHIYQQLALVFDDKTEVYEGDIVEFCDPPGYFDLYGEGDVLIVKYNEDHAKWECVSIFGHGSFDLGDTRIDKVLGNILEHPNLIREIQCGE